ncbi:hypothetical protein OWV82_008687 [Melia azedarach]|uniref:Uncharacterized protein n=2 Tax=Melia azedarach TaxID=155640 RepID=A0ACC1YBY8_MELAZ|nr:hypothetical protein OWV82_008687 [Melia azedarach]KAJ4720947.1 hypothetical protein OWV82_008687 [Melia azedarach]
MWKDSPMIKARICVNNVECQYDAAEEHEALVVVPYQTMKLNQQECLDSDPLFGIELDDEFCHLCEAWIEELFKAKIAGLVENGGSTGACVEFGVMQTMIELRQLPSEENGIAFSDGEIARSANVEWEATMKMKTMDEMVNEVPQTAPENYGSNSLKV